MSERSHDDAISREILSALADGQAAPSEAARAVQAWRQDPEVRKTWHAYHLIGETLRAPDSAPASDTSAFLERLRNRLADEPVILSPKSAQALVNVASASPAAATHVVAPEAVRPLKRRVWGGPLAVAASFAFIVSVLTANLNGAGSAGDSAQLARSGVGWSEGVAGVGGSASALAFDGSFSAARAGTQALQPLDPSLEQAMTVQRPQPSPPDTFAGAAGVVRVSGGFGR